MCWLVKNESVVCVLCFSKFISSTSYQKKKCLPAVLSAWQVECAVVLLLLHVRACIMYVCVTSKISCVCKAAAACRSVLCDARANARRSRRRKSAKYGSSSSSEETTTTVNSSTAVTGELNYLMNVMVEHASEELLLYNIMVIMVG